MNTFTLYWRGGKRQVVNGNDVADAMNRSGYGGGAVAALDFYAAGDDNKYTWDSVARSWVQNEIAN